MPNAMTTIEAITNTIEKRIVLVIEVLVSNLAGYHRIFIKCIYSTEAMVPICYDHSGCSRITDKEEWREENSFLDFFLISLYMEIAHSEETET